MANLQEAALTKTDKFVIAASPKVASNDKYSPYRVHSRDDLVDRVDRYAKAFAGQP